MKIKGTNLRLPVAVWKRIEKIATANHRSVTNQMKVWIMDALEKKK